MVVLLLVLRLPASQQRLLPLACKNVLHLRAARLV
jgi:hypothetical protein